MTGGRAQDDGDDEDDDGVGEVVGAAKPVAEGPRRFVAGPEVANKRLDVALAALVPDVSRSQLARQVSEGAVLLNGEPCLAPSRKLRLADELVWSPPPVVTTELVPEPIPLRVVHEDRWLIVVDKAAGMVVHPAAGHERGTLVNALLAHCHDLRGIGGELRPGIVHRIDKDTTGLLVVAKDDATLAALGAAFKVHDIDRVYDALIVGRPPAESGRIETLYGRDPHDRKKFTTRVKAGKRAVTNWRLVERLGEAAHLEARLETGRTHQVRVHFAAMGCSLLGDPVYGRPPRDPSLRALGHELGRQMLHARRLGFRHPGTNEWLTFEVPPPPDFQDALARLRGLAGGSKGEGGGRSQVPGKPTGSRSAAHA